MEILKQKLSSRKLWAAIIAGVASLVAALCGESLTPEIVGALDCVVTASIAYIFGEGAVDIARIIADAIGSHKSETETDAEIVEDSNTENIDTEEQG